MKIQLKNTKTRPARFGKRAEQLVSKKLTPRKTRKMELRKPKY